MFCLQLSILNEILLRGCAPPPRPPACSCVFMHTLWQLTFILTLQYSQWNPYIFYALPLEFNCLYYMFGQHVGILDGIDSVLLHFTYHILATYPSWPTVRSLPQPWVQPAIHSEKVFLLLSGTFWRHNIFFYGSVGSMVPLGNTIRSRLKHVFFIGFGGRLRPKTMVLHKGVFLTN